VKSEPLSAAEVISARSSLDQLMARIGVDGLVAAYRNPGLLAEVDQHVAAVRGSLTAAGLTLDAVVLARYARSVIAVTCRHGNDFPNPDDIDWRTADWHLLRLVAVCALADLLGCL
jgi:hypothetical protein